jgi:hypothetical protein
MTVTLFWCRRDELTITFESGPRRMALLALDVHQDIQDVRYRVPLKAI